MATNNLIGIRNGCLYKEWEEAFAAAHAAGAECLELDIGEKYADYPLFSAEGRKRLKELEAQSGVKLASICLGALWKYSPSNPDAAARQTAAKLIADTIAGCDAYGIPYILAPFTDAKGESVETQRAGWREVLTGLSGALAKARVRVAFELCARDFANSAQDGLDILSAAKVPPAHGVYFDTANGMFRGHRPEKEIPVLAKAKRLTAVHLKDIKERKGCALGQGDVDFPAVKRELAASGYAGPYILETPSGDDPQAEAKKNLEFAKKLFRG